MRIILLQFFLYPFLFILTVNAIYYNPDITEDYFLEDSLMLAQSPPNNDPTPFYNVCGDNNALFANISLNLTDTYTNNFLRWCASGGPGASSCSIAMGVCEVTCFPGYYACCSTIAGCRCIKDTSDDDEGSCGGGCVGDVDCKPCEPR